MEGGRETWGARLAQSGPLQGAPLSISALASDLGISTTPVREALSRLAGEGLVVRRAQGYVAPEHNPDSLSQLYDLARVLVSAGLTHDTALSDDLLGAAALATRNQALADACGRLRAQLAPLADAERQLFDAEAERTRLINAAGKGARALSMEIGRYYARRSEVSGQILAVAIGLLKYRRI